MAPRDAGPLLLEQVSHFPKESHPLDYGSMSVSDAASSSKLKTQRQTLMIDADDTLWENNHLFERVIGNGTVRGLESSGQGRSPLASVYRHGTADGALRAGTVG